MPASTQPHARMMILAAFICASLLSDHSIAAPASVVGTLKKWHPIELTFTHDSVLDELGGENPFLDYRLEVTFSHAVSQKAYRVPGYFAADGDAANSGATSGTQWRCRFTPDESGDWQYITRFAKGSSIAIDTTPSIGTPISFDGDSGTISIGPADPYSEGFHAKGRLQYVDEHYLRFAEDHEYFLKGGADSPENLLAYYEFDNTFDLGGQNNDLHTSSYGDGLHHFDAHLGDFQVGDPIWLGGGAAPKGQRLIGALNYLASKGVNSSYFLTYNIDQGDGMEIFPWVTPTNKWRFDVSKLDQWGLVFDHMTARGIAMHVITQEQENDQGIDSGALGTLRKLYYRELVARFGHSLALMWNLGEENTNSDAERKAFAAYFDALDPYDHPLTVHTFPTQIDQVYGPLLGHPDFDATSLQTDVTNVHNRTLQYIDLSANAGRKWILNNDEQTPADAGVKPDADDFWHDVIRKNALWGNLMAQGAGCEWYFGYAYPHSDLDCEDFRTRDHMWDLTRYAIDLFQDQLPFLDMRDADLLTPSTSDYVLAKDGEIYAIYRKNGGATNLTLAANDLGTYTVRWYDPRSGGALQVGAVNEVTGPGSISIGSPPAGGDDWLAILRRKGNVTPTIHGSEVDLKLTNGGAAYVSVHTSDGNGKTDIQSVWTVFVAPGGAVSSIIPLPYLAGDTYGLYADNLGSGVPSGLWTYYVIVTDLAGVRAIQPFTFSVP